MSENQNKIINISPEELDLTPLCLENKENDDFSKVIGYIEDIIVEDDFIELHTDFLEKYWHEFDESEENKLIYMDIFSKYIDTIEKYIETELCKVIPHFSIKEFEEDLKQKGENLDGEIFEILETFTDFMCFKNMILDYRNMKIGKLVDFSKDITVTKYNL